MKYKEKLSRDLKELIGRARSKLVQLYIR